MAKSFHSEAATASPRATISVPTPIHPDRVRAPEDCSETERGIVELNDQTGRGMQRRRVPFPRLDSAQTSTEIAGTVAACLKTENAKALYDKKPSTPI